jgi:hypothetical protein
MGKDASAQDFGMNLYTLGLAESYNVYNKNFNFPGASKGQIGGVATKTGCMENLLNSEYEIEDDWWICIKGREGEGPAKFTSADLQTILR